MVLQLGGLAAAPLNTRCHGGPDVDSVDGALAPAQSLDEGVQDPTLSHGGSCPNAEAVARVEGGVVSCTLQADCTADKSIWVSKFLLAKLKKGPISWPKSTIQPRMTAAGHRSPPVLP